MGAGSGEEGGFSGGRWVARSCSLQKQGLELDGPSGPGAGGESLTAGPVMAGGRGRAAWEPVCDRCGSMAQPLVSSPGNLTSLQLESDSLWSSRGKGQSLVESPVQLAAGLS